MKSVLQYQTMKIQLQPVLGSCCNARCMVDGKMAHFNREVIPERRMHAKVGELWKLLNHDISKYTKAKFFTKNRNRVVYPVFYCC